MLYRIFSCKAHLHFRQEHFSQMGTRGLRKENHPEGEFWTTILTWLFLTPNPRSDHASSLNLSWPSSARCRNSLHRTCSPADGALVGITSDSRAQHARPEHPQSSSLLAEAVNRKCVKTSERPIIIYVLNYVRAC